MMKKTSAGIIALSLFAGGAHAGMPATIAVGKNTFTVDPNMYVKEEFQFNVSSGVSMGAAESGSSIAVNSIHSDGRYHFGGSSEGGAVTNCEDAPLGATDEKTAITPSPVDGCNP